MRFSSHHSFSYTVICYIEILSVFLKARAELARNSNKKCGVAFVMRQMLKGACASSL